MDILTFSLCTHRTSENETASTSLRSLQVKSVISSLVKRSQRHRSSVNRWLPLRSRPKRRIKLPPSRHKQLSSTVTRSRPSLRPTMSSRCSAASLIGESVRSPRCTCRPTLQNILRTFVTASDLRTQVSAFMYGVSPPDNKQVKEIKAIAWVPQRGNNNSVELPSQLPKDDYFLKDLEPLGWIKTQALELPHLAPTDVTTQAKIMADHPEWGSSSICLTCAFTPGSVSLAAYSVTVPGFEWGRKNVDTSPNPPGFNPNMSEHVQLLLSDRILGMTLLPEGRVWM